jgi:hypothetical protein
LYSPDLAPSDFFLFGYVKYARECVEFPSEEILLAAIQSIVSDLMIDILTAVFATRIERLRWVDLKEDHYYR